MTTATAKDTARELSEAFEVVKRADGEEFYRLRDGSPEWMADVIREAHGTEMLPDNWRYETIAAAAGFIAEYEGDPEDAVIEFADARVDVYTWGRLKWLASNLSRTGYCDEAVSEGLCDGSDIVQTIGVGQYEEASEIFHALVSALEDFTSTR